MLLAFFCIFRLRFVCPNRGSFFLLRMPGLLPFNCLLHVSAMFCKDFFCVCIFVFHVATGMFCELGGFTSPYCVGGVCLLLSEAGRPSAFAASGASLGDIGFDFGAWLFCSCVFCRGGGQYYALWASSCTPADSAAPVSTRRSCRWPLHAGDEEGPRFG